MGKDAWLAVIHPMSVATARMDTICRQTGVLGNVLRDTSQLWQPHTRVSANHVLITYLAVKSVPTQQPAFCANPVIAYCRISTNVSSSRLARLIISTPINLKDALPAPITAYNASQLSYAWPAKSGTQNSMAHVEIAAVAHWVHSTGLWNMLYCKTMQPISSNIRVDNALHALHLVTPA